MAATEFRLSHTTNLGAILRHIEPMDELARWRFQLDLMAWFREKVPSMNNRNPQPVRLER